MTYALSKGDTITTETGTYLVVDVDGFHMEEWECPIYYLLVDVKEGVVVDTFSPIDEIQERYNIHKINQIEVK